jgi:hypothetical protein
MVTWTLGKEHKLTFGQFDFSFGGDSSTQLTLPFSTRNFFQRRYGTFQVIDKRTGVTADQHPAGTTHSTHIVILFFF